MRRRLGFLVLTAALACAGSARADTHSESLTAFERGKALRDQGKYAEAAKEFKEAVDKEKSVGGYYNLGLCLDRLGRYPEALKAYRQSVAIAQEKGDPRAKEALDAVQAVRNRTHWVLLNVRDDIAQAQGLHVEVDGREVHPDDYGVELFSSSSEHVLKVSAKEYADLVVHPPDRQPFTIEKLGKSLVAPAESNGGPAPAATVTTSEWGWQRWTGLALGVAGLAGLGYAAYNTVNFINDKDSLQAEKTACKNPNDPVSEANCNKTVDARYDDLTSKATFRNVLGGGLGLAALLGGVFLFVVEPGKGGSTTTGTLRLVPTTATNGGGFLLSGSF